MPDQIVELENDDGWMYFVRGVDPEAIYRMAVDEAASDDKIVTSSLDDVKIVWARTIPCTKYNCDFENHNSHYIPAQPHSRGAFSGAYVEIRELFSEEVADRRAAWKWGVGSDGKPSWGITEHPDEETARRVIEFREGSKEEDGPHRLYYRNGVNTPWRQVHVVQSELL